jgi:hydroxyacylglutathione hydrolase
MEERFRLRNTVDQLITKWLLDHKLASIELIVTYSHGHGDHTGADHQFVGRPKYGTKCSARTHIRS